jgi:hypothetical protein
VDLAAFDACVEACDALAASSHYSKSAGKLDPETGLQDCSVLVSPDGDLLIIPQDTQDCCSSTAGVSDDSTEKEDTEKEDCENDYPTIAPVTRSGAGLDLGVAESDAYESAVIMGNDLRISKTNNGFSAMGWSPTATSLALRQTSESLREMTAFVEMLILSRKETAARESHACDVLRAAAGISGKMHVPPLPMPERLHPTTSTKSRGYWRRSGGSDDSGFEYDKITELEASPPLAPNEYNRESLTMNLSSRRVGPLSYQEGSLYAATCALEQYHSTMAENDSSRWRKESMSRSDVVGVLPALRKAADQAAERAYRREKALREMQTRAAAMEQQLENRKVEAKLRWNDVHEAEELVTRIVEVRMMERARERDRRRMEKLHDEEDKRLAENTDLGATPGEIWDIVSAVAESMEDGSFAPTGLPQASLMGPRDRSQEELQKTEEFAEPEPTIPLASRVEIEHECRLPELRAAAMTADEEIEDAAGALLNILSTLDTTRRSARIAAETCLLSAARAQAACIRSLVALERASIEDRMQNISELERIADDIDVRADLDAYIIADKQEQGGSTWLGDDDDGGVASALAILSSHADGSVGMGSASAKVFSEGWDSLNDEDTTPEMLEDAVEGLFAKNDSLLETAKEDKSTKEALDEFESTVKFLCTVAEDSSARSRRSTICYALNSKRSSSAEIPCKIQFDALCRVFRAILSGCDREAGGVSNTKMCMMLAQTFYMVEQDDKDAALSRSPMASSVRVARSKRIFVKNRIMDHPTWDDEEFW